MSSQLYLGSSRTVREIMRDATVDAGLVTSRTTTARMHALCPFSTARDYAVDYLRRAAAGGVENEIQVPILFLPTTLRRRMAITFSVHPDTLDPGRPNEELRFVWSSDLPLIPRFDGTIRFRIDAPDTGVCMEVRYVVPFGLFGMLFDSVFASHVVTAGVRDFCRRVVSDLENRERLWRSALPI